MLGAIIGDIVGSRFEFNNHRSKDFELFTEVCFVTDDSIMTIAVSKAIMETEKSFKPTINGCYLDFDYYRILDELTLKYMQEIGRKYPNCGYGGMFDNWMFSENPIPYNSFGNGAAMRISPVGFIACDEFEAIRISETITSVTHNHDEGIKGAAATAVAIFMASHGYLKSEIKEKIVNDYYPIDFTIDEIRPTYHFNETCQGTVPQALECFFESESFEDAIRIAISLGGDSDTIAAITGSIAQAYYGIPEEIQSSALKYLDDYLLSIYTDWTMFVGKDAEKYKLLTKYIGKISPTMDYGEWNSDQENDDTQEHMIQLPFVGFSDLVISFEKEFYQFVQYHPEFKLDSYGQILEANSLKWDQESLRNADCEALDAQCILALIMSAIRAERFCDGALLGFLEDGSILKWLKRLKDIDCENSDRKLSEIHFQIGGFEGDKNYQLLFIDKRSILLKDSHFLNPELTKKYSILETENIIKNWTNLHTEYWKHDYPQEGQMRAIDGTQWSLFVRYEGSRGLLFSGDNTYPESWEMLLALFDIKYDDDDDKVVDEKPERKPGEIIYCKVTFNKGGTTYYYQTEDENIEVADRVIVPVGPDNHERIAVVNEVEYFARENVPFPLDKVKRIIRKCTDDDFAPQVLFNKKEDSQIPEVKETVNKSDNFYCPVYDGYISEYDCCEICCGAIDGRIPNDGIPELMDIKVITERRQWCLDCVRNTWAQRETQIFREERAKSEKKTGDRIKVSDIVDYRFWTDYNGNTVSVSVDFKTADDFHYDLGMEAWHKFQTKVLKVTNSSINTTTTTEAFKEFFENNTDLFDFEEALKCNGIPYGKTVFD